MLSLSSIFLFNFAIQPRPALTAVNTDLQTLVPLEDGFQVYGGPADQPWIGSGDKDKQLA